jgi:glycosyltransferase involved in cell wall biosynthesis
MMLFLAITASVFLLMLLINAMLNLIFQQQLCGGQPGNAKKTSVLIPARNEEKNLGKLLTDLVNLKNQPLEILVMDDQSEDQTAQIVQNFAEKHPNIQLLRSKQLPDGWLGKNHACHQLGQAAKGSYFLFLDADVRIENKIIADAVCKAKKHKLALLSVFPKQKMRTFGERASVPVMNYILLSLLPLILVRKSPYPSHAAANGQFMLFDAAVYRRTLPHQQQRHSVVEDIVIARSYKEQNLPIACITGDKRIKCRMYSSYQEAVQGFSKNVFMFFGGKPVLAFLFWIFSALGFLPVLLAIPQYFPIYAVALLALLITYASVSKQNPFLSIILFPVHLVFMLQIMINGLMIRTKKRMIWKGRSLG